MEKYKIEKHNVKATPEQIKKRDKMYPELMEIISNSGLSGNRFAVEVLGFKNESSLPTLRDGRAGNEAWEIVEKYLDSRHKYKWVVTNNLETVWDAAERAYQSKEFVMLIGNGGYGKSYAIEKYIEKVYREKSGRDVRLVDASKARTRKQFVALVMEVLGCYEPGVMAKQLGIIQNKLAGKKTLLVIDEASALDGHKVTILKDLMTTLRDVCGILIMGTPYLKNNIISKSKASAHLFSELEDRIFMLPEQLQPPTDEEAEVIFRANGLTGDGLDIAMGTHKDKELKKYSWKNKMTYRGIRQTLSLIKDMAGSKVDFGVKKLQVMND